jgi:hypothetical protein
MAVRCSRLVLKHLRLIECGFDRTWPHHALGAQGDGGVVIVAVPRALQQKTASYQHQCQDNASGDPPESGRSPVVARVEEDSAVAGTRWRSWEQREPSVKLANRTPGLSGDTSPQRLMVGCS